MRTFAGKYLFQSVIEIPIQILIIVYLPTLGRLWFEPAVLFSMSLFSLLLQYRLSSFNKICLKGFHQLLNVLTQSHLVKSCCGDAALILTFLRISLLCSAVHCEHRQDQRFTKNSCAFGMKRFVAAMLFIVRLVLRKVLFLKPMINGSTSCNVCCSTNVEQCCTNVLNGIELVSIFVQHRSTTFNVLNGIFQHST